MANPIPNSLALINVAAGADILSADHRTNYADLQARINALITALSGGTAGQVLQAAGASSVQYAGAALLAAPQKYGTLIDVVSSVAETDILQAAGYTIPANTLGANGIARVTMHGDFLLNTGGTVGPVIRVYLGGTKVFDWTGNIPGLASIATRHPFRLQFDLANLGATNSQALNGFMIIGAGAALTAGLGGSDSLQGTAGNGTIGEISATSAIDTTAAALLRVTAQLSSSSVNNELRVRQSLIEFI